MIIFIILIIEFILPIYYTFKVIKGNNFKDAEGILMFWSIIGFLTLIEQSFSLVIQFIPFYNLIKLLFIIYILYFNGSSVLFMTYLKPFLDKNEIKIEYYLNKIKNQFIRLILNKFSDEFEPMEDEQAANQQDNNSTLLTMISQYIPSTATSTLRNRKQSSPTDESYEKIQKSELNKKSDNNNSWLFNL